MNIFYDENMPFAKEFFGDFFGEQTQLTAFNGRTLTADDVACADVLLVRSVTKVNQALLAQNKNLAFVGTATIGVDHIEQSYLSSRDITFTASPGCNAISVAEYVLSSLVILSEKYNFSLKDKTVGIIGGGNTGTRTSEKFKALGIDYKICDPLLAEQGDSREFVTIEEILSCDIISLHVPLTRTGEHPTYHLLNEERLKQLKPEQILINACRGEVIDNQALLALKQDGYETKLVLDVWENEPNILMPLIEYAEIASAHIAGYSLEGKSRGTEMLYQALCRKFEKTITKSLTDFLPEPDIAVTKINSNFSEILLNQTVKMVYDVRRDDAIFRQQISDFGFDHIRKTYPVRREFSSLTIIEEIESNIENSINTNQTKLQPLYELGFKQTPLEEV
ncbi:4-phosphoerythronate dehydrogenase [Thalassotalea agariperforans]